MARGTRSSQFTEIARRASAILVAVVFALGVAVHGLGERSEDHLFPTADTALTMVSMPTHNSPSDALCSHIHIEHHQMTQCAVQEDGVKRHSVRIVYAVFGTRAASRETSPPHGPPKA